MLKHEVEALLKIEHGEEYTLRLFPVRLSKKHMVTPTKFDWRYRRAIYWVGELDIERGNYYSTNNYHITNHRAASELYRKHILCK